MLISRFSTVCLLSLAFSAAAIAQTSRVNSALTTNTGADAPAAANEAPKLEHFDPTAMDKTLDPCDDFYK